MITQNKLKNILSYDEVMGTFTWLKPSKYHVEKTGKKAGSVCNSRGKDYVVIRIDGSGFKLHRLAWLYVYGEMPDIIDHINGDSLDNRISNLRSTSILVNTQNHIEKIKDNGLPTGVCYTAEGKFRARISVDKKVIYLGVFSTSKLAHDAYRAARSEHHDAPVMVI